MRMNTVERDVARRGVGCPRQSLPPDYACVVSDSTPINSAQDDRLAHSEQYNAQSAEWIIDAANRLDPAAAKWMAQRRRYVTGECR
jgi:hypothetical protein